MDRLTAEDLLMLWPDEIWPQEIGALAILNGSLLDPSGRFRIEAVRDVVAARLHLVPRFRQLLCVPRRGLGGPLWVDAPAFDISEHMRVVPLPGPGDEAGFCTPPRKCGGGGWTGRGRYGRCGSSGTAGEAGGHVCQDAPRHRRRHRGGGHSEHIAGMAAA